MNDVVKISQSHRYKLSIFENGNVLTMKSEQPLLRDSRMESFDFPLRESSLPALSRATDFGDGLVSSIHDGVSGATGVQLQLYQATVTLDGIYDRLDALQQMKQIIKHLHGNLSSEPVITTELHRKIGKKDGGDEYVHPFGKLALRLHEVRQRGRRKLIR